MLDFKMFVTEFEVFFIPHDFSFLNDPTKSKACGNRIHRREEKVSKGKETVGCVPFGAAAPNPKPDLLMQAHPTGPGQLTAGCVPFGGLQRQLQEELSVYGSNSGRGQTVEDSSRSQNLERDRPNLRLRSPSEN
jgi:hypothetical protein